jgi:membrane-associated phospholipid phosphatase
MAYSKLQTPERLLLGYFAYLAASVLLVPVGARQRLVVITANLLIAAVLLLVSQRAEERRWLRSLRPWLPFFFILVAYRESGLLLSPDPAHRLDFMFIRLDNAILKQPAVLWTLQRGAPWIQHYLEMSYLLCYPIVPLGLASLYLVKERGEAARDHFWTAVLLASLTCYFLFPFFPLAPPRELFNDLPGPRVAPLLRALNHWFLGHYAVGASLFPSAHVASTTAMALVMRNYLPRLGWVFVVVAASIALATIYGRYHYALDAMAGILVGMAAYWVACRWRRPDFGRAESNPQ